MAKLIRLDQYLVENKLVNSLKEASILINRNQIRVPNLNSKFLFEHTLININDKVEIEKKEFVSRGGGKLNKFIEDSRLIIKNKLCLDVGASTGGFTDSLLQNGAKKVYCLDVGKSQLDTSIKNDERVEFFENINARYEFNIIVNKFDVIVVDVSFISVLKIVPNLIKFLSENSKLVILIKPQFEAKKSQVSSGGVIKDDFLIPEIINDVIKGVASNKLKLVSLKKSQIKGRKGNQEFFAMFKLS